MVAFWTHLAIICTILIAATMAQRPSYAGSAPIGRPDLHSRFRDTEASSTATPDLNNRVGQDATTSTVRAPVDARGDQDLVNRLNEWPRDHRPFWLLNAEAIEAARNQQPTPRPTTPQQRPVQQQQQQSTEQQLTENRNNFASFEDEEVARQADETIPIRPTHQRSSFLRPIL